jgi:hypothetical protein
MCRWSGRPGLSSALIQKPMSLQLSGSCFEGELGVAEGVSARSSLLDAGTVSLIFVAVLGTSAFDCPY